MSNAKCLKVAVCGILGGMAATTWAQTARAASTIETTGALDEVIVTATRRENDVQKVPISVSVVSEKLLDSLAISQTSDLTRVAPALTFSSGSYGNTITFNLRGISTFSNSNATESSVGVSFDGVPLGRTVGMVTDAVDVSRVEVLRGPQGTLFGKNSTGGLLSIVTNEPTYTWQGNARVYYGSHNEFRRQGTLNLPLIDDRLALRVSGWMFSHDPYVKTPSTPGVGFGSLDTRGARLRFRVDPADGLKLNYTLQYAEQNDSSLGNFQSYGYDGITTSKVLTPNLLAQANAARAADLSVGIVAGPDNYATSANIPSVNRMHLLYNTLQLDADVGNHTLTWLTSSQNSTGYNANDGDNLANVAPNLNAPDSTYAVDVDQVTSELRLASPSDQRLSYVAGLFYFDADIDTQQLQTADRAGPPFRVGRLNDSRVKSRNYAAFGEATFNVTDSLRFLLGGRYAHDDIKGSYVRTIPPGSTGVPNTQFGPISVSNKDDYSNLSFRAGVQYDLAPSVNSYATVSTGYKGPGFNYTNDLSTASFALNGAKVTPEKVTAYEIGVKSELFDRRLRLNSSVYYARYTDFQVSAGVPGSNPVVITLINARELVAKGAEFEAEWRPTAGLTFSGNVAYSDGEFTDFKNAPCYFGQTAATGCINGNYDVKGLQLPNSPKLSGNLTARYDWRTAAELRAFAQANMYYKDRVYYTVGADPSLHAKSYSIFNVTTGLRSADDRYGISLYGKNIFNKHFASRLFTSAGLIAQILSYDSKAAFGASVDVKF